MQQCVADTVGCNLPNEYAQLIDDIKVNTPGIQDVILAAHCHNDLGLSNRQHISCMYSISKRCLCLNSHRILVNLTNYMVLG